MVSVKVEDLEGAALDWAVAQIDGAMGTAPWVYHSLTGAYIHDDNEHNDEELWSPSTDWSQGGPLVDQFIDSLRWIATKYYAWADDDEYNEEGGAYGPTLLIAACRAIVAAKLGDDVDVPEELAE